MGLLDALQDPTFRADVGKNAKNLLQSTSNTLAENVSMPVDVTAWLLRKAGVPIPENPTMGSDWMRQNGLTAAVQPGPSAMAGETLGLLAPMSATKQGAAAAAKGLLSIDDHAMNIARKNIEQYMDKAGLRQNAIVWHGSPHKFDKFDASKIGTGEGAQAYGHGLYLAESPSVAGQYSQVLSDTAKLTPEGRAARALSENGDDLMAAKQAIYKEYNAATSPAMQNAAMKAIDVLQSGKVKAPQLYKVDLPDEHIAKMLDWDKPLSQQSKEVQKALEPLGYKIDAQATAAHDDALLGALFGDTSAAVPKMPKNPMGADIARGKGIFDQPQDKVIAEKLRQAGIPGIRYLDGGSRGAGAGSSNFVVFPGNEGLLNILERNGQPVNKLQGLLSP